MSAENGLTEKQREMLTKPDARMESYYFGFERTGADAVDAILSAIAWAGKGSHSTDGWADEEGTGDYGPFIEGQSYAQAIQAAAVDAAKAHGALLDRLRAAEAERDELRDKLTRPLPPDSHDADWWRRASSFWAGQDEMHERELRAAEARAAEAEAVIANVNAVLDQDRTGEPGYWIVDRIEKALAEAPSVVLARVRGEAWDEGWDLGNEYAISEPFDDRAAKSKNPYREVGA